LERQEPDWVARLQPGAEGRDEAIDELRQILVRGLSHSLRNRGGGQAFAEDVAQEAIVKILDSLDSFEGRSRFTTWAMTIATRIGISDLRRRHFQDVSLDHIAGDDALKIDIAVDPSQTPSEASDRDEVLHLFRDVIAKQLTEKQRTVLQASLAGMPIEEIASRMNSNRNAIYKVFHDARKKLRTGLESRGVTAGDIENLVA